MLDQLLEEKGIDFSNWDEDVRKRLLNGCMYKLVNIFISAIDFSPSFKVGAQLT